MSISDNKMNALSDDELSRVSAGTMTFENLEEFDAWQGPLNGASSIIVADVEYCWKGETTKNFYVYTSESGAVLLVPLSK